jgi:hypothetical protein
MGRRHVADVSTIVRRLVAVASANGLARLFAIAAKAKQPKVLRVIGSAVGQSQLVIDFCQIGRRVIPITLISANDDAARLTHPVVALEDGVAELRRDTSANFRRFVGDDDRR